MKSLTWILLGSLLLAGCATSTIATRKQERIGSYSALTPEQQIAVDLGRIKVGMSMDAVYIAWGKPSQILHGESPQGPVVTWLYLVTYFEEYYYWTVPNYYGCGRYYTAPYLIYDYQPRGYVRAEVNFEGGVVKEWRSLARPGY